ncbi:MAG: hypothetical protein HZA90_01200 [Verrucomicrobia bacterium]|nr:hypothetical protein [Verrucomicrobiota bacterium]
MKPGNNAEWKETVPMATKLNPDKVKKDSNIILGVWTGNPDFKMKDVTLEGFRADCDALDKVLADIADLDMKLTPLRNQRDDLTLKLNETNTRARSGMKGFFGPNSTQYEQAGGTRATERKKSVRKPKTGGDGK